MNPFARYPFMRYVLPFITGITLQIYFEFSALVCFSILLFTCLLIFAYAYSRKLRSNYTYRFPFAITLTCFWIALGTSLTSINNEKQKSTYFEKTTDKKYLVVKLKEPLSQKRKSFKALGEVTGIIKNTETIATRGLLLIYFLNDSNISSQLYCGDEILLECNQQEIPSPLNPGEFSFKDYLAFQNIHSQIFVKPGEWILNKEGNEYEIMRIVFKTRDELLGILNNYIADKTERGVAGALLFGYKDELDRDIVDAYARTGTLHVLAVSGMHVAILFFVVSFLFKPFQKNKVASWLSAILTIALIWFYSMLSGMAPSIIRASVMFTLIVLGKTLRDDISIYNNLFTSACLLLCYDPYYLFDAGFQLSYLAVFGIVYFQPKIARLLIIKSWIGKEIWTLITVSLAAQIATAPISLYYFNQFPNYFMISNLIIIPITTLVMYGGIILIVICKISFLASGLGYGLTKLIAFADYIILKIQSLPYAVTEMLFLTKQETLMLYLTLFICSIYLINAQRIYLKITLLLIFILTLNFSIKKFKNKSQQEIVLNAINGSFSINIIEGANNNLFCDTSVSNSESILKAHFKGFWNRSKVSNAVVSNSFFNYHTSEIVLTPQYLVSPQASIYFVDENFVVGNPVKVKINYLVLCRKCNLTIEELKQQFDFDILVLDGSMKPWRKKKYISEAKELQIDYHDLLQEGAIVISN